MSDAEKVESLKQVDVRLWVDCSAKIYCWKRVAMTDGSFPVLCNPGILGRSLGSLIGSFNFSWDNVLCSLERGPVLPGQRFIRKSDCGVVVFFSYFLIWCDWALGNPQWCLVFLSGSFLPILWEKTRWAGNKNAWHFYQHNHYTPVRVFIVQGEPLIF